MRFLVARVLWRLADRLVERGTRRLSDGRRRAQRWWSWGDAVMDVGTRTLGKH